METSSTFWQYFFLYLPLGIIGLWRWSVWLFQTVVRQRYRPVAPLGPNDKRPTLSVVTPVYNEDPAIFRSALLSWKRNDVDEIIAVIDESDQRCIEVFRNFQKEEFKNSVLLITDVPGKRPALALGSRRATGDILALVDSDTLWDDTIRDHILSPFADESVGGVATVQAVLDPVTPAERLFDIRFSLRYKHEYPYLMVVGDALTCLSGRTAVYRRTALLPVLDDMLHETFLGKPCISGEDKRLSSLVMAHGWKLRFQDQAVVRTPGMPDMRSFLRQNLRWSRNSWRTDLRMLGSAWIWKREPLFAYHLIDRAIQPFTLLLGPLYFVASLAFAQWLAASLLLVWFVAGRTIKLLPHLRDNPRDLPLVPLFTAIQYYLAVIKLYALLTLDFQSWITRWDKSRLKKSGWNLVPSQAATASLLIGLFFVVFNHTEASVAALEEGRENASILYADNFSLFAVEEEEQNFWRERESHMSATYASRPEETPLSIIRKFNIPADKLGELFPNRSPLLALPTGTTVQIPIDYLLTSLTPDIASRAARPLTVEYRPDDNLIHVSGGGNIVTLRSIAASLPADQTLIVEEAPGEWLLQSKLYISEDVTLVIDGGEVKRLKLKSDPHGYTYVRSQHGSILINETAITSWDAEANGPDMNIDDGRAFVVAYGSGRMDILNSDIGYLGTPLSVAQRYQNFGGNYGLSWKIQNGTFGQNVLSGNVIGNTIHHNYFGLYTFGTSGMLIRDNEFAFNLEYGIDPHDDSNNLFIEHNSVHDNGNHGIIVSKRVNYTTIRFNQSYDNRLHGIMLDKDSNYNLVEGNTLIGNVDGVAIAGSHFNLVRNNTIRGNGSGIRASIGSKRNFLDSNVVTDNNRGIFLYDGTKRTIVRNNLIQENAQGVYLKDATLNAVIGSLRNGDNLTALKMNDNSKYLNFIERIPE